MSERCRYRAIRAGVGSFSSQFKFGNSVLEFAILLLRAFETLPQLVDLQPCLVGLVAESADFLLRLADQVGGTLKIAHSRVAVDDAN